MNSTTAIEVILLYTTYQALQQAAQRTHKSEVQVALEAIELYLKSLSAIDPLLGLFANEPDLIEQAENDALISREKSRLRLVDPANE